MSRHTLQHMMLLFLGLFSTGSFAGADKPQQVQDLQYGEVLFHFYQDDYFTAISHLMAAQAQSQLPHHHDEAELLLGGLQLSYGMLDQAEERFENLLDPDTNLDLRNRAWFYLTKISYQHGLYENAAKAFKRVELSGNKAMQAELAVLGANIYMAMGKDATATDILDKVRAPEGWKEYLQINKGIAQLRAGDIKAGQATLDKLGREDADSEELLALRDRANLALGYQLLREGEAEQARKYLDRVRLRGPFMQEALLGAGWADAERGNYEAALTPWLRLNKLDSKQPAALEVRLAVPYSFAQLGDRDRAIYFYEQAIDSYDTEQADIDAAIQAAESGALLELLAQADTHESGGWLHDAPALKDIPSGRYLVDVLSQHAFQENLKDYRDLGFLQALLTRRLSNIELLHDMVDTRRLAYEKRSPAIRERLEQQQAQTLHARWLNLGEKLEIQVQSKTPLGLATGKEQQQLATLDKVEKTLARLPDSHKRKHVLQDKARWLHGILYWQIQADYPQRLWDVRKQLQALKQPTEQLLAAHNTIEQGLKTVPDSFSGYDKRIETLRNRIHMLQPAIHEARRNAGQQIYKLAMQELGARRERLVSYRAQARYALARSYDQLAGQNGAGGKQ
ncbi:lipopolysaccharide biosynthesis regulator YciM [Thiogranum longum]|uniref:Lipopolysaccharide biosynthesis regulator YciM n=1 Tax=Thiogranum longum TaxID=1537524 RepID=A0A4R1H5Q7_9GAMM|nr:hypothetical protein [Thiogranum longum]TCK17054.1 lipopolysaccharide biosynthesis regulator YciM [Thiogranum longum]